MVRHHIAQLIHAIRRNSRMSTPAGKSEPADRGKRAVRIMQVFYYGDRLLKRLGEIFDSWGW